MAQSTAVKEGSRPHEIREAALTLFAERGYHGTTMTNIADVLGIRAPSLYNHVESKEQVLLDIMFQTLNEILGDLRDAIASSDDPVEQLRRATEAHVRYHTRHRRDIRIGNTEIRSLQEPERIRLVELRRTYTDIWEDMLRSGMERGVFHVVEPRLVAFAILEMGIGISLWFREDGPLSEAAVAYHYADMALRMAGVGISTAAPATLDTQEAPL